MADTTPQQDKQQRNIGCNSFEHFAFERIENMSMCQKLQQYRNIFVLNVQCYWIESLKSLKYFKLSLLSRPPCTTYRYIYWQFQAYETIHRFENLQKQNNTIIHRISHVEDMLAISGCHGTVPNNLRDRANKTGGNIVTTFYNPETRSKVPSISGSYVQGRLNNIAFFSMTHNSS